MCLIMLTFENKSRSIPLKVMMTVAGIAKIELLVSPCLKLGSIRHKNSAIKPAESVHLKLNV